MIAEIVDDAKLLTAKHQISVTGCQDVTVFADRSKLGQVLLNLLSNAIKYSPAGGKITIDCEQHSDKVRVSVSDEGIGISPEEQKELFKRFYRTSSDKAKNISGFGIGLYLVAEILRHHGSHINVESKERKGSRFYFDLETTA